MEDVIRMDTFQSDDFSAAMTALRTRYLEGLVSTRAQLAAFRQITQNGDLTPEERNALGALAHKLAGNGATYGFDDISRTAEALKTLRADTALPAAELAARLDALIAACDAAKAQGPDMPRAPIYPEQPIARAHEPHTSNVDQPAPNTDQPLILVVDDDPVVRDMLEAIAGPLARVKSVADGQAALNAMHGERPDLVLLDDQMPGAISGMRLQEIMREDSALCFVPVIFISASNDTGTVVRGLTGGAADYIVKPFDSDLVAEKITTHLRKITTEILIVEDDISVATLLEQRFIDNGFKPRIAGRVDAGFAALQQHIPDLIVLDRNLPDGDGADLLERLRELPGLGHTPVVFLTARDSDADIRNGCARGADDYVVKPFNPDDVVNRCARLLGNAAGRTARAA